MRSAAERASQAELPDPARGALVSTPKRLADALQPEDGATAVR